jgi:Taurine catabolism dioxygenase TauD, TfdA family
LLEGIFCEQSHHPHVRRRQEVLRRSSWYPPPPGASLQEFEAAELTEAFAWLKVGLDSHGVALIGFDRILTNTEFVSLASLLGLPQIQGDSRLAPYVEDSVILNLRADHGETKDLTWELLFAENYVMMHTELAGRLVEEQVRYLLFQCVVPTQRDQGGQTLLVRMDDVRAALSDDQARILSSTRHAGYVNPPPLLSVVGGRQVFAVKDAEGEELPWRYSGADPTVTTLEVNDAIASLLAAIYRPECVYGFEWRPLMFGAFDNTRFLHARSFARRPENSAPRHLREIRVFLA